MGQRAHPAEGGLYLEHLLPKHRKQSRLRGERAGVRNFRCAAGKEPFHKRAVGVNDVGSVTDGEIQSLPMREK